jgi:hypothetical protein
MSLVGGAPCQPGPPAQKRTHTHKVAGVPVAGFKQSACICFWTIKYKHITSHTCKAQTHEWPSNARAFGIAMIRYVPSHPLACMGFGTCNLESNLSSTSLFSPFQKMRRSSNVVTQTHVEQGCSFDSHAPNVRACGSIQALCLGASLTRSAWSWRSIFTVAGGRPGWAGLEPVLATSAGSPTVLTRCTVTRLAACQTIPRPVQSL